MSDKVIDPGAEFSKPRDGKLSFIIEMIRKRPACTLAGGEGKLLLDEIDRLNSIINQNDKS